MRTLEYDYHRVVDRFTGIGTVVQRNAALQSALAAYNLRSVAYLGVNIPKIAEQAPYIAVTYSDAWVDRYRQQDYVRVDPAVTEGFNGMLPLDWQHFDLTSPRVRQLFGEAREHGLGRHGLTIPIRGRLGERAVFTVTSDDSDREWNASRQIYMRDFLILALHLHQSILTAEQVSTPPVKLARQEVECLKWASAGKTVADIGVILGLSHRTVKGYLDTARSKLNALNTTHAVTKAYQLDIIRP